MVVSSAEILWLCLHSCFNVVKIDLCVACADAAFRAAFDPKSKNYHNGIKTAVPIGDAKKIPESMMGEYEVPEGPDLSKLEYGEEYDKLMAERTLMNKLKPCLVSILCCSPDVLH